MAFTVGKEAPLHPILSLIERFYLVRYLMEHDWRPCIEIGSKKFDKMSDISLLTNMESGMTTTPSVPK